MAPITPAPHQPQQKTMIGVNNLALASTLLESAMKATLQPECRLPDNIRGLVSMFEDLDTQNPVEVMLLSQMASTHAHIMHLLVRSNEGLSLTASQSLLGMANKLMRTFANQVEAFEKFKRGGKQSIKVDHVHVHEGGQAIVGNIQHPGTGGVQK